MYYRRTRLRILWLSTLLVIAASAIACGGSSGESGRFDSSSTEPTTDPSPAPGRDTPEVQGARETRFDPSCVLPESGATGLIAFTKYLDTPEIWLVAADGTGERRLLSLAWDPSWSPDGTRIAFVDAEFGLWRLDLTSCSVTPLSKDAEQRGWWPAWSPKGDRVAFVGRGQGWSEINLLNLADGSTDTIVRSDDESTGPEFLRQPSWAPSGDRLVFVGSTDDVDHLYVIDIAAGAISDLYSSAEGYLAGPSWSPDGSEILFGMGDEIHVVAADGSSSLEVTDVAGMALDRAIDPIWTEDARVMFAAGTGQGDFGMLFNLYVINRDGSELRSLTGDELTGNDLSISNGEPAWFGRLPVGVEVGPAPVADECAPFLRISTINHDADGDDNQNLNGEWVEIENLGCRMQLDGWVVHDETIDLHRYVFPAHFVLPEGASVRLHSGEGTDTATDLYWGNTGSAIWNNNGDTVYLLTPHGEVAHQRSYS